jgi:hypothetical protein
VTTHKTLPVAPDAVSAALAVPGRTLIFCDDTDIAGQPVPWLEPDLRILVAVEMGSEAYAIAAAAMAAELSSLGVTEFHAADMANPQKKSPWKALEAKVRVEALHKLTAIFNGAGARVSQARVPKAQFAELKAQAQLQGKVGVGFKHGLRRVFLRCLFERLEAANRPAVVVIDQDKPLAGPVVEHWPEAAFLVESGPIAASSADVAGLQLADLAAWSINRMLCRLPEIKKGGMTDVDGAALEVVGNLDGGLGDVIAMAA